MQVYSETDRGATEKNLFPRTPAQHAGLLHPLKAQGRASVARILPEPVGWKEQTWAPWELEAVLARGGPDGYLPVDEPLSRRAQGSGTGPGDLRSVQRRGLLRRARAAGFVAGGGWPVTSSGFTLSPNARCLLPWEIRS